MEEVILVDEKDQVTGTMEKMAAHQQALLHRAFSVFIFNSSGDMLLQQRALDKYHSGGLWTNSCCSHPRPGEETMTAAARRLHEEMGFTTSLEKVFDFIYNYRFSNGLSEHEFDHVFVGYYDGEIKPDRREVTNYDYRPMHTIAEEVQTQPEHFTAWFRMAFPRLMLWWTNHHGQ